MVHAIKQYANAGDGESGFSEEFEQSITHLRSGRRPMVCESYYSIENYVDGRSNELPTQEQTMFTSLVPSSNNTSAISTCCVNCAHDCVNSEHSCGDISSRLKRIRIDSTEGDDEGFCELPAAPVCNQSFDIDIAILVFRRDDDGDSFLDIAIIALRAAIAIHFIKFAPSHRWLNTCNSRFQTPLHLAVLTRQVELVRRLVVGGAEVDRVDIHGNTPLHIACAHGYSEIVRELVKPVKYTETKQNNYQIPFQRIPQDFDSRNYDGFSCFHLAARNSHFEAANILLNIDKDVLINTRELQSGKTMLHYAADTGNFQLVRFLIRVPSIDVNSMTYDGVTPLEIAHYRGHEQIKSYLLLAGAEECYIRSPSEEDDSEDD